MNDVDTAFSEAHYESAYPLGIDALYWHLARNRVLERRLKGVAKAGTKALEIGCGPGVVVQHLRGLGIDCHGVDLGHAAPVNAEVAPFLHLGVSAFDLPQSIKSSSSLLLLLDMLEHRPEPAKFLSECTGQFPNVKHIFVTLPARMEIWSSYDNYYRHYRRYSLETLSEVYDPSGLSLVASGYFFHGLYWAARLRGLLTQQREVVLAAPKTKWPHALLGRLFSFEEEMIPPTMFGSSLFALLERRA